MGRSDQWKTTRPEEQLTLLVRDVRGLLEREKLNVRLQGIRLESRKVAGQRQLWAVVEDATASNDGAQYLLAP